MNTEPLTGEVIEFKRPEEQASQIVTAVPSEVSQILVPGAVISVTTQEEYAHWGKQLAHAIQRIKDLEKQRVSIKEPILESGRKIDDLFKGAKEKWEWVKTQIEPAMRAFVVRQDQIRKEQEAAAAKKLAEEKAAAAEAAEKERKRLDDLRKQQEAAEEAAKAAQNPFEALAAERKAEELRAAAEVQVVAVQDAIRETAAPSSVVTSYAPKPRAAGTSIRRPWKFEIVDASLIPREYLEPNETKIGQAVRELKDKANIPGVRAYEDITIGGR